MQDYETLTNMGIQRFDEIRDYSFFQEGSNHVLKIYYTRKEGSLLPRRKVFKFPVHVMPNDHPNDVPMTEPSATVLEAVEELNRLLKDHEKSTNTKEEILRRIEQLESEVKSNAIEIRSLLERL